MAQSVAEHVTQWAEQHRDEVIEWRRHFHRHPELSHMEFATTDFIEATLRRYGLNPQRFPNTGLMVDIGPDTPQKSLSAVTSMPSPSQKTTIMM